MRVTPSLSRRTTAERVWCGKFPMRNTFGGNLPTKYRPMGSLGRFFSQCDDEPRQRPEESRVGAPGAQEILGTVASEPETIMQSHRLKMIG